LFDDESSRRLPQQIQRVARRKLLVLHQARSLMRLARAVWQPFGSLEG
jgi:plasmid maintenance system killer protein